MDVFAAALGDLLADPHVGVDAEWRQGGVGLPVVVRVVRSSPDRVASAFDTAVIQATDVLTVAVGDAPDLASGDSFAVGPDVLTVTHAERDAIGVAWRGACSAGESHEPYRSSRQPRLSQPQSRQHRAQPRE